MKIGGTAAVYHCMTRTVNGEMLFKDREKEMLRKMLWQVADFSGVEVLTYCVMSNHFHVLGAIKAFISSIELTASKDLIFTRKCTHIFMYENND